MSNQTPNQKSQKQKSAQLWVLGIGYWEFIRSIRAIRIIRIIFIAGFVSIGTLSLAITVYAQTQYNLIEPLPGIQSVKDFPDFVSRFIPLLLAFAALAAFVQIVFGGILRATSGGNPTAIGDANNRIWMAVGGLVLALSAYLILNTINPDLVNLKFFIPPIKIEATKIESPERVYETETDCKAHCPTQTGKCEWLRIQTKYACEPIDQPRSPNIK